jgi:hypothetical protein
MIFGSCLQFSEMWGCVEVLFRGTDVRLCSQLIRLDPWCDSSHKLQTYATHDIQSVILPSPTLRTTPLETTPLQTTPATYGTQTVNSKITAFAKYNEASAAATLHHTKANHRSHIVSINTEEPAKLRAEEN